MIIMDEPTSSLGEKEVAQLMKTCRELRDRGIGIVFVSHKLEELFELCDRVEVIRDGQYIDTRDIKDWTNDSLIAAMVGRTLDNLFPKEFGTKGEVALKAEHLMEGGVLDDVSFEAGARLRRIGRRGTYRNHARHLWRRSAGQRQDFHSRQRSEN